VLKKILPATSIRGAALARMMGKPASMLAAMAPETDARRWASFQPGRADQLRKESEGTSRPEQAQYEGHGRRRARDDPVRDVDQQELRKGEQEGDQGHDRGRRNCLIAPEPRRRQFDAQSRDDKCRDRKQR
jgi:hypothetical protein